MEKVSGIYLITVARPGELPLYYVGQSIDCARRRTYHFKTLKAGRHDNERLQHAHNKYGREAMSFQVLERCSAEAIDSCEQWWLDEIHGHARVVNIARDATSPNRGRTFGEETRRKVAAASRGRLQSNESRQLRSATMTGRPLPEEVRAKIAATRRASGRKQVGAKHHASKPVRGTCITTGKILLLESAGRGREHGFDPSGIGKACRGEWPRYKGYLWCYATT